MKLATRTVENYRSHIQEKIGAGNVVGIALYALMNEIVKYSEVA
jgi:DNA-binding CsgD family transcriptional regulator